jgi:hypothetical protein
MGQRRSADDGDSWASAGQQMTAIHGAASGVSLLRGTMAQKEAAGNQPG